MKRHANLIEHIVAFENLLLAAKKASRGKRGKRAVAAFNFHLENELIALQSELKSETYHPRPYTQFEVREPKVRKICSSHFRDRVVHHSICNLIEPILEKKAVFDSYACRYNKGAHLAVKRCQEFSRKHDYYLKCDIKKFFESIDHSILKSMLDGVFKDKSLLRLLNIIIDHEVPGNPSGRGLPIGNLTSQHFANYYFGKLDHYIKDQLRIKGYVRYMDDFISFSNNKDDLHELLSQIEHFVSNFLKLELKSRATIIAPVTEGIPFLGFRIFRNTIRLKRENLVRARRKIRNKEKLYRNGKLSEKKLLLSINSIVGHVAHVNSLGIRRKIFEESLRLA